MKRYDNTAQFIMDCDQETDIDFAYMGQRFHVLTWPDEGIVISKVPQETDEMVFQTADELLDEYRINNIRLRDLIPELDL